MQEQLLERIAIALERLAGEKQDLGIFDAKTIRQSTYIFGGGSDDIKKGVPWYILSDNSEHQSLAGKVVRGKLKEVRKKTTTHNFGESEKLEIELSSTRNDIPHNYIIRFGWDTVFTSAALQALTSIPLTQGQIIGIYCEAGERAVMGRFYNDRSIIKFDWQERPHKELMLSNIRKALGLKESTNYRTTEVGVSETNKHMLLVEINSLKRRKNLSDRQLNTMLAKRFNNRTLDMLSNIELTRVRDGLQAMETRKNG
ncbi:MAG: hypothetical protein AAF063_19515 [Cyanobacteria bacterium J06643_5]